MLCSYRAKSPTGQDAQLAEKKFMLGIPLARESVRYAHTLFDKFCGIDTIYGGNRKKGSIKFNESKILF